MVGICHYFITFVDSYGYMVTCTYPDMFHINSA